MEPERELINPGVPEMPENLARQIAWARLDRYHIVAEADLARAMDLRYGKDEATSAALAKTPAGELLP